MLRLFAATTFLAASGCWIVAGLEDRTLAGAEGTEGGTVDVDGGDGAASDGTVEGSTDGGTKRCYVDDPFEEGGTLLMNLGSPEREYSATLTEDELEIFVSTDWNYQKSARMDPFSAIWHAKRGSRSQPFDDLEQLPFDANIGWGSPTLAERAGALYLVGYPDGGYPGSTYIAARLDGGGFSTDLALLLGELSGHDYIAIDSTGDTFFFAQRRSGVGPLVLWKKEGMRNDGGLDGAAVELASINGYAPDGGFDTAAPVISRDREVLYFVIAPINNSKIEVYRAKRAPTSSKNDFDALTIQPVTEVNAGSSRSWPVWISPDLCRLYVSQFRGTGTRDLYVYEKRPR